ncbi:MGMT family protein [Oceanobacillus iheyensis]|uniref:Hypothetical conserved protein n=1 Tax=Oceanobacillus iheyensis (strain DSM 14371 / CIP 107618 / JCM 11309 / KCTC 3954 / HTE831) TaxID=221109 RepID=Q8ELS0_OCEIH|nr:MGMT family protein [Oceanobacillus iheyensis]BAC15104.1 hypothetical conserved protein [Oceanobacillus iheyensis HTE831]
MTPFTERVIEIMKDIPYGKVMTYGQIAANAGSKQAARQVVRILHSMSGKYQLPWHRVINAQGKIGIQSEEGFWEQRTRLESEGVKVDNHGKISLECYQWFPGKETEEDINEI